MNIVTVQLLLEVAGNGSAVPLSIDLPSGTKIADLRMVIQRAALPGASPHLSSCCVESIRRFVGVTPDIIRRLRFPTMDVRLVVVKNASQYSVDTTCVSQNVQFHCLRSNNTWAILETSLSSITSRTTEGTTGCWRVTEVPLNTRPQQTLERLYCLLGPLTSNSCGRCVFPTTPRSTCFRRCVLMVLYASLSLTRSASCSQGLGSFPLVPVSAYVSRVPPEIRSRGGYLLVGRGSRLPQHLYLNATQPIYQREAMWINLGNSSEQSICLASCGQLIQRGCRSLRHKDSRRWYVHYHQLTVTS
jgi:hypothetical protein